MGVVTPLVQATSHQPVIYRFPIRAVRFKGASKVKERFSVVKHQSDIDLIRDDIGLRCWIAIRLKLLF